MKTGPIPEIIFERIGKTSELRVISGRSLTGASWADNGAEGRSKSCFLALASFAPGNLQPTI
jgi:hypothetical protein